MILEWIGNILIGLSVIFVFVGLIGVFRFENFFSKLLASSKIDTVAMVTMILGVSIRSGLSWFTWKALLVMIFVLFMNPIVASKIAMSARQSKEKEEA